MSVPSRGLILLLLPLLLATPPVQARVFESLGRSTGGGYDAHPGWTRAYSSTWTINGGRTDVEVWNVSSPLARTLDRLRADARARGDVAAFFPGISMAWGVEAGGGRVSRFVCNGMESGRQTLVFRFSQTEADFNRARSGPDAARLPEGVPVPPGAKADFTAAGGGGTTLAVFTVPGNEAEARAFMAAGLVQAGWSPAFGPAAGGDGMGFYTRDQSLCGFSAKMSRHDGSCTVTIIHRQPSRSSWSASP